MKEYRYFCNCETDCIHKSKHLQKVKTWEKGKWTKSKVQVCLNPYSVCTCKYQVSFGNVFHY